MHYYCCYSLYNSILYRKDSIGEIKFFFFYFVRFGFVRKAARVRLERADFEGAVLAIWLVKARARAQPTNPVRDVTAIINHLPVICISVFPSGFSCSAPGAGPLHSLSPFLDPPVFSPVLL